MLAPAAQNLIYNVPLWPPLIKALESRDGTPDM